MDLLDPTQRMRENTPSAILTSALIAKLRGHGLITKVKNSRLYRLTARGLKAMWPAVRFRRSDFPRLFREAQAALAA